MPLVQSAFASKAKAGPGDQGSTLIKATFTTPTTPGNYVAAIVTTSGGLEITHLLTSGWVKLKDLAVRDLQVSVWGRENAPSTSSISAYADAYRGMTLRVLELSAVAQASALDRLVFSSGESAAAATGATPTTTRADETVIGILANQYSSTAQSAFAGGMTKLFEDVTPDGGTQDWEQSRTSVHQLVTNATGSFSLSGALSTPRRWIGVLITLKGSTIGPAKFSSTLQPPQLITTGRGRLTVFGPLRSTSQPPQMLAGGSVRARIGPSDHQYRLGGWSGLLIGAGTDYRVESIEGLEGFEVRNSDTDQPREAGALRGVDLQTPRLIAIKVNFDGLGQPLPRHRIEELKAALLRALVPQRDEDWEFIWRHPGQPLKSVYVRPATALPALDPSQVILHNQPFALRAADPRHYSATINQLTVPVTVNRSAPVLATAINVGNGFAYPTIRVAGPAFGAATRVVLTNLTTTQKFDVAAVLPAGSGLVGDMRAQVTGGRVSPVTIDGTSKYGAWQPPRIPFALAPGVNSLMFEAEPAGASPPLCTVEFRSTWSG